MASNEYSDIVLEIVGQIGIIKVGHDGLGLNHALLNKLLVQPTESSELFWWQAPRRDDLRHQRLER
jgi:hypothetical protein